MESTLAFYFKMDNSSVSDELYSIGYTSDFNQSSDSSNSSSPPTKQTQPLLVVAVPAIMFASGVFGNLLALFVLYRSRKDHKRTVFYRLVGGLACTDLFGTAAVSPVTIMVYNNGRRWLGGQPLCNYFSFMMIFAGMATVLIVGAMAVERYVAIIHPYAYEAKFSSGKVIYILVGVWLFAFIVSCLPLVGLGTNVLQYPGTWCFFDVTGDKLTDKVFTYFYASVGLVVISMTALCNASVMCVLARMRRKLNMSHKYSQSGQLDNEAQMMVLLAGIILVFATCYAPLMVRVIINQTGKFPVNHAADLWAIRLACLNQILDPWVYILFRKELFTRIWRLVYCVLCVKRKQTTSSAILEKKDLKAKTEPLTSKPSDDEVFEERCDASNAKSPKLQIFKNLGCCSPGNKKGERKGSGRALLIPMMQYGRYGGQSTNDWSDIREGDERLVDSPSIRHDVVVSADDMNI
ncbi:prostaglandin E2 receptor EP4 subtype-like isoform X1 [Haliotis rufescens]|uniref:prostaglandin E2 receptor EP4 subtype-like isoform X1 n=1 Tax=Haliotis rufescens TaxID=6454 RepID=UPI00201F71AE|nr:prostaglandin E2 receptor EP4 subtype-like isoform X1 [Haliotis rufescens]